MLWQPNLTQVTAPDTTSREYVYDSQHRMTSQISELGLATSYYYATSAVDGLVGRREI